MKKLNLGCGTDVRKDWINLDIAPLPGVDVVHDLKILPLPFESGTFDYVLCNDILEHFLDYAPLLAEIHRVLKTGGDVEIKVPHYTYSRAYADPTHLRFFSVELFEFFTKSTTRPYYFNFFFDRIVNLKLTFLESHVLFYNKWIERFVNKSQRNLLFFEKSFMSGIFPAENIVVTLRK